MDVIKIIGIGFLTLIIAIIIKEYRKEYYIYVVLIGGALILISSLDTIKSIVSFINELSYNTKYDNQFITLLLKLTGISILIEYAVSVCKDAGENGIASKIDFGGKIVLISMSIPVISVALEALMNLLP